MADTLQLWENATCHGAGLLGSAFLFLAPCNPSAVLIIFKRKSASDSDVFEGRRCSPSGTSTSGSLGAVFDHFLAQILIKQGSIMRGNSIYNLDTIFWAKI